MSQVHAWLLHGLIKLGGGARGAPPGVREVVVVEDMHLEKVGRMLFACY